MPVVQRSAPQNRSAVVPLRASQPQGSISNSERVQDPRRTFDAEIALGSALKHLASSRFDHAELELEQLCQLRPGHRDAQIWLRVCRGRRLKAERKAELAQEEYRAVLELDPEHREALENVGPRRRRGGGIGGKWFDGGDE
jgi:predicted Zn-dependent protease